MKAVACLCRKVNALLHAIFLVDCGADVGLGHVMRCATLARELRNLQWTTSFFGNIPEALADTCRIFVDGLFQGQCLVPEKLKNFLASGQADVVCVDHYGFSTEIFAKIRKCMKPTQLLMALDDVADRVMPVDFVVNPNPGFDGAVYAAQGIATILSGAPYAVIRPEVVCRRARAWNPFGPLLITLGGGNTSELLMKVLSFLPKDLVPGIIVSLAPQAITEELQAWMNCDPQRRKLHADISSFPCILAEAGYVISGGGTTLWEAYCLGIPSLAIVWVENQRNTVYVGSRFGTGGVIDLTRGGSLECFPEFFQELIQPQEDRQKKQRILIDGKGAHRIVRALQAKVHATNRS